MLNSYLWPFVLAGVISAVLTPFLRKWVINKGWVDNPGGRRINKTPIPRMGGLAVFISWLAVIVLVNFLHPGWLNFTDSRVFGFDKNLLGVLLGGLLLVVVGIIDDARGLKPSLKLIFQFLAATLVVIFGLRIWWFSNPFGSNIILGSWSPLFVILWIVLMINVVNWWDGVDGLASGISIIASLVIFLLSIEPRVNQTSTALLLAIFAGALIGFFPYNFFPAKIFLGDTGSMFLGFILAVSAIISGGKVATALLVLGLPILDALWVVARRLANRKSPFLPDVGHMHHRLLQTGFSQRQVVSFLYFVSATFGVIALNNTTQGKLRALTWLIAFMLALGITLVIVQKRRIAKEEK